MGTISELSGAPRPAAQLTVPALVAREARRRQHRHRRWWSVAALIVAVIAGTWLAMRPRATPLAERFRTAAVDRGDVVRHVRATGHVEAVSTVLVGAEISGKIATVEADFNDHVEAGQVLARFDRAALEAQSAQAFAALEAARSALEQAKVDAQQTQIDLQRTLRLIASNAISQAERDTAESAARLATARVSAAEAQVSAQRAAQQLARVNLDHAVIRAPIDGVIITRNVDPGQTVASVLQTPVLFELAADLRKMRVIAAVDEADIGEVSLGQDATFTVDAFPDRTFAGRVTEVRSSPVVVQDVVTYGTVVEVDNLELLLKPGMTAPVRIHTGTATDTLRVPSAALRFTPPNEAHPKTPGVWVLRGQRLEHSDARAGISDGEITAIADAGSLQPGDVVVVDLSIDGRKFYGRAR